MGNRWKKDGRQGVVEMCINDMNLVGRLRVTIFFARWIMRFSTKTWLETNTCPKTGSPFPWFRHFEYWKQRWTIESWFETCPNSDKVFLHFEAGPFSTTINVDFLVYCLVQWGWAIVEMPFISTQGISFWLANPFWSWLINPILLVCQTNLFTLFFGWEYVLFPTRIIKNHQTSSKTHQQVSTSHNKSQTIIKNKQEIARTLKIIKFIIQQSEHHPNIIRTSSEHHPNIICWFFFSKKNEVNLSTSLHRLAKLSVVTPQGDRLLRQARVLGSCDQWEKVKAPSWVKGQWVSDGFRNSSLFLSRTFRTVIWQFEKCWTFLWLKKDRLMRKEFYEDTIHASLPIQDTASLKLFGFSPPTESHPKVTESHCFSFQRPMEEPKEGQFNSSKREIIHIQMPFWSFGTIFADRWVRFGFRPSDIFATQKNIIQRQRSVFCLGLAKPAIRSAIGSGVNSATSTPSRSTITTCEAANKRTLRSRAT